MFDAQRSVLPGGLRTRVLHRFGWAVVQNVRSGNDDFAPEPHGEVAVYELRP